MSDTTLRFYNASVSYTANTSERKIKDMKRRFRTRVSRRRAKQAINNMLHHLIR